ncbi:hypothetical protein Q1695_000367 [Nippostrongylus brasiliensis]|nr:hypothetical protein Q1695_000367 [Nippostrongylus brasiliensis]
MTDEIERDERDTLVMHNSRIAVTFRSSNMFSLAAVTTVWWERSEKIAPLWWMDGQRTNTCAAQRTHNGFAVIDDGCLTCPPPPAHLAGRLFVRRWMTRPSPTQRHLHYYTWRQQ